MKGTLLYMENISKSFPGVKALDSVDFELKKGEVHGLLGENGAGKSTLVKILTGAYTKDEGKIFLNGKEADIKNPRDSLKKGIVAIYQELNLIPQLSAAENIFIGKEITKKSINNLIDWKTTKNRTMEIISNLGQDININIPVNQLGIGQQQMVEIARAISTNARIIVMDEPTSSLGLKETKELFRVIKKLKSQGISIIYITHKLDEIFEICDRVTVMRDGQKIITLNIEDTNKDDLIKYMVGRTLDEQYPKRKMRSIEKNEALRVVGLTKRDVFEDISFVAYSGEILGIFGLVGAGRTEIARAIFGADSIDAGEIYVKGNKINIDSPIDAMNVGIAFLTEDRKNQGLVPTQDIANNITLCSLKKFKSNNYLLNLAKIYHVASKLSKKLNIKTPSIKKRVSELSGGNQQKVVVAKWLCYNADIFIFDEPTRGIDVGAKTEIYNIMNRLVEQGACVIMISSELPEILGMSDRIIVVSEGKITGEFKSENANQEILMKAATGGE